ncbi:MAG: CDP-glycerol:poly(glycerophosphate) glycerophosphotransferase [Firmicutes bacterium ADurb.Bin300]|nr:MAG: CDP-glycerol:poly(glycerophosphate) glycerophosphotransferase [Firmicutes bacterium ADurb.Bin300]
MKRVYYSAIKKFGLLRRLSRLLYTFFVRINYKVNTARVKTDDKTILFGAFNGKSYCDSPKQIFLAMQRDDFFKEYKFIWVMDHPEKYKYLMDFPHTAIVKNGSVEYERALKKSRYWITNFRVDYYLPGENQCYIQCWHGTPLKKLGYDIDYCNNSLNSVEEFREKYLIDGKKFTYILSPSPFTTEKFTSAFNLKALGKENAVIEQGYPRNDYLYNYTQQQVQALRQSLKIPVGKKVILYAPTWRDNSHESGIGYSFKPQADFDMLRKRFGEQAVILFRAHYFIASRFNFDKYSEFVYNVSDFDDIAELYVISDVLITDYSSVFFDYANLTRPMIFYMYDLDEYVGQIRDFYFPLSELPGDIVKTDDELAASIKRALDDFVPDERYMRFKGKFNPHDDGGSSARVIDRIFKGEEK